MDTQQISHNVFNHLVTVIDSEQIKFDLVKPTKDDQPTNDVNLTTQVVHVVKEKGQQKKNALVIFAQCGPVQEGHRKQVIALFKSELGMSDQGASTYYQNIKSGKWK